jgi:hypothetical protein
VVRRPFDAHSKLGIDPEPSDYDLNISSSRMVEIARASWDPAKFVGNFVVGHGYLNKAVMDVAFPTLARWKEQWSALLDRDISHAVFASEGPWNITHIGIGVSSHYRDTDWMMHSPGDPVPPRPDPDPLYPSGWRKLANFGYEEWDEWPDGIPRPGDAAPNQDPPNQ